MRAISLLFRNRFYRFKTKRVIPIGKETVKVDFGQSEKLQVAEDPHSVDVTKVPWEAMNLAELGQLGSKTLNAISYELNKTKHPVTVDLSNPQEESVLVGKLNPVLQKTYRKLVELAPQPEQKQGRLAQLYDLNLKDNAQIMQLIQTAYSKLAAPQGLMSVLEPSLIKYLVGLNSDLARYGLSLKDHIVQVDSIRPINIEYEFWVGVNRNRSRNHSQGYYVSYEKELDNPNNSLLMQLPVNRKILLKYIVIKRRPEKYFMGYIIKSQLEAMINGNRHYIKVQFEGPQSENSNSQAKPLVEPNYRIIDIDNVMNGNPTIRPVFRFG